ncbi:MAG: Rne/Rng family ribonuclease [Clostridia bacterium]|nr:Rne/Rng family ribonuclease [Clostridia bacterium]
MLELIIDKNKQCETICLVENGKLLEKYKNDEETKKNRLEGNIYAGKVNDIVPGMQAAFIDYGDTRKGFIHFKDAIPQIDEKIEKLPIPTDTDIRKVLKPNSKILVQIKKDSNDKKGAKVSTHISLPSKYIVFMPNTSIITISQKIDDSRQKERLVDLLKRNLPNGNGVVIRTAALNASDEEIIDDINRCCTKWKNIENRFNNSEKCELIYESESIAEKIIIDLKLDKVITNSKSEYEKIKETLESENITCTKLELSKQNNLLEMYDLEKQIKKSMERKIWLNCGGFITIDKTEALTAIDVNTGKFTGGNNLEETIFKVNKEATIEIAKQLRLCDIGGIIIIDYIDMKKEENKQSIENMLKDELKKDRAKTQVEGFTKLNLMELTRKHICSHLND